MKDMVKKGRAKGGYRGGTSPGERNGHSKLTDQAVREIRVAAAAGVPKKELAKKYGVDPSAVSHMLRGKTWRHVTTDA